MPQFQNLLDLLQVQWKFHKSSHSFRTTDFVSHFGRNLHFVFGRTRFLLGFFYNVLNSLEILFRYPFVVSDNVKQIVQTMLVYFEIILVYCNCNRSRFLNHTLASFYDSPCNQKTQWAQLNTDEQVTKLFANIQSCELDNQNQMYRIRILENWNEYF